MSTQSFRRRGRASELRISVRDKAPVNDAEDSDVSDSEDEGDLDSPSPTSDGFPSPVPGGTIPSTSSTGTQPAVAAPTNTQSDSSTTITAGSSQGAVSQNEPVQAQATQVEGRISGMSKDGAIALGAVGGVIIIATILFIIFKCRRRRTSSSTRKRFFWGSSSSAASDDSFRRAREPQMEKYGGSYGNRQSRTMDDLMAAAYAAEDGNASRYSGYMDEKRQVNGSVYGTSPRQSLRQSQSPPRHSQSPTRHPLSLRRAPSRRQSRAPSVRASVNSQGENSLYVNQLLSGFYKGQRMDGPAVPRNARVPPPIAPSVAGRTEYTATTESTWRTWGWQQKKEEPKESWVKKCVRLGGLK